TCACRIDVSDVGPIVEARREIAGALGRRRNEFRIDGARLTNDARPSLHRVVRERPAVAEFVDVKSGRAVVGHDDHVGRSIVEDDAAAMTAAATVAAVMAAVMAAAAMAPAACVFGGL